MTAITKVEGIGSAYAEALAVARVGSVQQLLQQGSTRAGRSKLARLTGISSARILAWVNRADLSRVRGVGEEYSDLLETAGVDSVPELARRRAVPLWKQLAAANETHGVVRRLPSVNRVEAWIQAAQKLPRIVKH